MKRQVFPGWWQVAIGMLTQATATGTIVTCFSVIVSPLAREFAVGREELGLIMTLTYLISGLANPFLGSAMDRFSIRKIMLGGGLLLGGGYLVLSSAHSIAVVFIAYGVPLALASAALGPLSYSTLLPRWFVLRRARAVGLTVSGYAIGGLFLPPLFAFLIDALGWRDALRIFAGFVIVVVIPLIGRFVIDRPSDVGLHPDNVSQPVDPSSIVSSDTSLSTKELLRSGNFWVITICISVVLLGAAGLLSNMVPLALSRGFSVKQGAFFLSLFSAGSLLSKLLYVMFGDRLPPRAGLAIGLLFFTLSSTAFLLGSSYPILLMASLLHGMGVGVSLPLWSFLTARVFGTACVGRVFGLMNIVMTPFSLLAPPLMGHVYDRTGSYQSAFVTYVGIGLATLLLATQLRVGVDQAQYRRGDV